MTRESFLKTSLLTAAGLYLTPGLVSALGNQMLMKTIPSTGEQIPAIGMGSWLTFNVGQSESERAPMRNVLKEFISQGGRVIDSSPMYGRSEQVIGELAAELEVTDKLWVATKVWTQGKVAGKGQIENSLGYFRKWPSVLQVHNLVDLETHLETLRSLKEEGKLKYVGVTHYLDHTHKQLAEIIKKEKLDFIQINLSIRSNAAEDYLLPLAADHGVAVIINQPFETGGLFNYIQGVSLPDWAKEYGINSWAEYFLKYIISNPAVTCTIPATTQVAHVKENMASCYGELPDQATRIKMKDYFKKNAL
ncbi:MAG: aldo/keto reductase [Imperialibacter sp.]|uniref:aldo/keto reductase n=1 Tax=Imperialibacter sp. TaxID=2038411 RepID=UPI0032ECE1CA